MAYEELAASYDRLTEDIPYEEFLQFYKQLWQLYGKKPESALDLACGTGSLSVLLAREGLRVTGADVSEQMLTEAYEKAMTLTDPPYFVRQSMQRLHLPAPVDFAVCCLDGINYLTRPEDCRETFRRVFRSLAPGGLFVFDINSEQKLRALDGQLFLDEDDEVFCLWRASFDETTRVCSYGMDIFRKEGRLWSRAAELHEEYAYTVEELAQWLTDAGFDNIRCFGDRRLEAPAPQEQRIFFAAERKAL